MSFCSYTFGLALSTSSKERGYVCLSRKEWLMEQKMLALDFFFFFFFFFAQQAKNREERNQCYPKLIKLMLITIKINHIVECLLFIAYVHVLE